MTHRLGVVATLVMSDPEQVAAVEVIRIALEDASVQRFGLRQLARLMQCQRLAK